MLTLIHAAVLHFISDLQTSVKDRIVITLSCYNVSLRFSGILFFGVNVAIWHSN